ncbi:hypothetical protein JTE90_015712, partial [Oedothorax gibbosus]
RLFTLETCWGIWVRTGHENYTISLGFSRAQQSGTGTPQERGLAFTRTRPYSGRPIPGPNDSYKEKINSSPGPPSTSSEFVAYRTWSPKTLSPVSGLGNINPIPLSGRQRDKPSMCLRFGRRLASERISPIPLGSTDPCSTAVQLNPFSSFSPSRLSLEYCYYHQDLHRWRLRAGSRPALQRTPPGDPPLTAA